MTVEDARRIVSLLRLTLPYRDKCALVTLLADAHGWHAASDVADLLVPQWEPVAVPVAEGLDAKSTSGTRAIHRPLRRSNRCAKRGSTCSPPSGCGPPC